MNFSKRLTSVHAPCVKISKQNMKFVAQFEKKKIKSKKKYRISNCIWTFDSVLPWNRKPLKCVHALVLFVPVSYKRKPHRCVLNNTAYFIHSNIFVLCCCRGLKVAGNLFSNTMATMWKALHSHTAFIVYYFQMCPIEFIVLN